MRAFSKARSKKSPSLAPPSTSSSPIASSTSQPTKQRCSKRPFGSSSPVDGSPSPTWSSWSHCRRTSSRPWTPGRAAWRAPSRSTPTAPPWSMPGSTASRSKSRTVSGLVRPACRRARERSAAPSSERGSPGKQKGLGGQPGPFGFWVCDRQATRTREARGPLGADASTSKLTFCPSCNPSNEPSTDDRWKKYSLPSSPLKNPNPRSITSRLIVPFCATSVASSFAKLSPAHLRFRACHDRADPARRQAYHGWYCDGQKYGGRARRLREGSRDAKHNARLPVDAAALSVAGDDAVSVQGDRDATRIQSASVHLRPIRSAGGAAGPCPEGARRRCWRPGRHPGMEQLPTSGALFRGPRCRSRPAYVESPALPGAPAVRDQRRRGQGDFRRRLDPACPAADRRRHQRGKALRRHDGWPVARWPAQADAVL